MAYNTGNPVPSTDAKDFIDNCENIDKAVNSLGATFQDRLGVTRSTYEGIVQGLSFFNVGTFAVGFTLTNSRQTLTYGGHEYGWSGAFPKAVSAGSTPTPLGPGGWIDRSDVTLRGDIEASVFESLRRSYADAGLNLVDGSFEEGGTLTTTRDVLLSKSRGVAYSGPLGPVLAGTDPESAGFVNKGDAQRLPSSVNIADFGVVFDFVFNETANTFSGTDNLARLNEAQDYAIANGMSLTAPYGKYFGINGKFTSTVHFDLNGSFLCQLNRVSDTVSVTKTGGLHNGTIYTNMSTGVAWSLSGDQQIFPGRNKIDIGHALRISNSFMVRAVGLYVGTGVAISASGSSEYVSGIKLDVVIQGYADAYKETTTGESFINSNDVRIVANQFMRCLTQESSLTGNKIYNIGQSHYHMTIQPQSGSEYAMKIQARDNIYTGQLWDAALMQSPSKSIQFVDVTPSAPNNVFKTCVGNTISMYGVNVDRCYGQVMTNTINNPAGNNPSNIKDPASANTYDSQLWFRKNKLGASGVEDTFNYISQVDNVLSGANLRLLTLMSRTNAGGANLGSITPSSGVESSIYKPNEDVATFSTTDYLTLTVSLKEGLFPLPSESIDFIGVKFLNPVPNVILEVRFTGDTGWTSINSWSDSPRNIFSSRINPKDGSVNVVRTQSVDGIRIRAQNPSGVIEVENVFAFSPTSNGLDCVNPYNPMIFGSLNMAMTSTQGILFRTPDNHVYKMTIGNGGVPVYTLIS